VGVVAEGCQHNEVNLRVPLVKRLEPLQDVVKDSGAIHYVDCFEDGRELYRQVEKLGLQDCGRRGKTPIYVKGRSRSWLKIKTRRGT
jgi:ATP-dependent DNA ligase